MIIKGGSRAGPRWLGQHLTRTDTNERVEVLELQSPHDDLTETFRDWQVLAFGTRGHRGLYHANIDPAMDYVMTPEQWQRSVEVLERELKLEGQPRAVVLHEKNGREHLHVVWSRTDLDTMKLCSDSHNYAAHERASLALEREFGHEHVPGKHAKRDRDKQPDMPDASMDHHEWQQAERGGLNYQTRKEQVTALYQAADSGPAFKAALEDAGYVVVRGDTCDFMLLEGDGKAHSLVRQLPGVNTKELRAFMAEVDPAELPGIAEARAVLRAQTAAEPVKDPEPMIETEPEPALAREDPASSARAEALRASIMERQAEERKAQETRHSDEISALQEKQLTQYDAAIDKLVRAQTREAVAARNEEQSFLQTLKERLSLDAREARQVQEAAAARALEARHKAEMDAMHGQMQDTHKAELNSLVMNQAVELDSMIIAHEQELAKKLEHDARMAVLEYEKQRRAQEARDREGPERDDRAR
jgi:hypothetical protein